MNSLLNRIRDMRQRWVVLQKVQGGGHLVVHCGSLRSCERFKYPVDGQCVIVRRSTYIRSLL